VIIRIMGEGQLEVDESNLERLNQLDETLDKAIQADDDEAFRLALTSLLHAVRESGQPVADDVLKDSDLVLPYEDAHVDEVKQMLGEDGLIPD